MATAPDSDEGKVLASAADMCGACEDHLAVKHCNVCPVNLCVSCAKAHTKLKVTTNHPLSDIARTPSKSTVRNGTCGTHKQQPFTILCKDCVQVGCDSCKAEHSGHSLQSLNDDPKLCQRVCSKHIQHLLDDLHEIEEIKSVLEGQIITYDEAIGVVDTWEVDLLKLVKEKASKLRKQLKDLKDEKYKQIKDKVSGLMTKLKEIDLSIATLNETRKSMDYSVLSNELSKSKALMEKLETYKDKMKPHPEPINVADVLSNENRFKDAEDDLEALFTVGPCTSRPFGVAEWHFTKSNNGKDLSRHGKNPVTMTNIQYGPGPNGEKDGAAILPTSADQTMIVMNPTDTLRFNDEMAFFIHIFLDGCRNDGFLFLYDTGVTSDSGLHTFAFLYSKYTTMQISSSICVYPTVSLSSNAWHKIAIVFQASTLTVYIDGKLTNTHTVNMDLSQTKQGNVHFGKRPGRASELTGRIACCKFFDKALDVKDILKL